MSKKTKSIKASDKKLRAQVKSLDKKLRELKKKLASLKKKNSDLKGKLAKLNASNKKLKEKPVVKAKKESSKKKTAQSVKQPVAKAPVSGNGQPAKSHDSSTNYNVKDAIAKLRTLTTSKDITEFTRSETRLSIKKLIPGVRKRLQQH